MFIPVGFGCFNAEPMWQLGLGGGPESYPERPDEPDCIYYLRTGFCGYGNRCRFNHPRDRGTVKCVYFLQAMVLKLVSRLHDCCDHSVKSTI